MQYYFNDILLNLATLTFFMQAAFKNDNADLLLFYSLVQGFTQIVDTCLFLLVLIASHTDSRVGGGENILVDVQILLFPLMNNFVSNSEKSHFLESCSNHQQKPEEPS